VEVHLLDWDGDLYGQTLRLSVLHRIRDERRFPDAEALVTQMRLDEAEARRLLAAS
jgi:riboflavin kinase/FMN adenylyltransferase